MTRLPYEEVLEVIKTYETIIVHRHMRPDPDALGSQGGLVEILKASFPAKKILKAGGPVGDLAFLATMDDVMDKDYQDALVIVTDTANRPRISDERYLKGTKLIKIDHHPNDDAYGDFQIVNIEASSCSEIIVDFYTANQQQLTMTDEAARLLYAGIVGDTGRFLYPSTTPHTMRVAAGLMEYNFIPNEVNNQMNVISQKVAKLTGYVLQNIELTSTGVAKVMLTKEVMERFGVMDTETSSIVAVPGTMEGVLLWGIFVEQPEGHFRCRLRSKGPVINEIAKLHHGGGHPLASGANAKNRAEVDQIIAELEQAARLWS
ncbi:MULTISPECIES: DHH family phosphoesterase [Carnobacterium]|uniref:Bifunctional oligoribonuclease/PAP phosphatase NrnA n=1 Tax=Carnobacterium antarcticum TaxID=2126436 RepID=A0ABW4NR35_9LACT|nr:MULTISPECIES: bifunctional oligoribonuclease/PAP phosphatase NrnA [unclassified Carnobacterium]ALV22991.1 3'-to-5' oligoribonuclease A [Carnobacterium sp. CP1]QQP70866.1 bifunctional oligoribonuclease/PAP phosphatase NrnA [Carnobacterium sp. CS13]